jgi:thiol:disulfide interchange protein
MSTQTSTEGTTASTSRGENFYLHALLGAVVTVVTAVVPFSPIIGGAVAGYLHDEGTSRGTRVGLVSGVIASIPLLLVFFFMLTVMSIGSITTGEVAGPAFVIVIVAIVFLVVGLYTVGLSAAGGYIGASFAASRVETPSAAPDETPAEDTPDEDR